MRILINPDNSNILTSIILYKQQQITLVELDHAIDNYITDHETSIDVVYSYDFHTQTHYKKCGTALAFCVDHNFTDVVELLLIKYKANPHYISPTDGMIPLVQACLRGNKEMVGLLINAYKSQNLNHLLQSFINQSVSDHPIKTPLIYAVLAGHIEIVKLLIDNGADCNIQDAEGNRAFDYARGNIEMAREIARKSSWSDYFDVKWTEFKSLIGCHNAITIYPDNTITDYYTNEQYRVFGESNRDALGESSD